MKGVPAGLEDPPPSCIISSNTRALLINVLDDTLSVRILLGLYDYQAGVCIRFGHG